MQKFSCTFSTHGFIIILHMLLSLESRNKASLVEIEIKMETCIHFSLWEKEEKTSRKQQWDDFLLSSLCLLSKVQLSSDGIFLSVARILLAILFVWNLLYQKWFLFQIKILSLHEVLLIKWDFLLWSLFHLCPSHSI